MTLAPLLAAPLVVQLHAFAAIGALGLTALIFSLRKGSPLHRMLGWAWVLVMAAVAVSSFWINGFRWIGPFGPIHLLSLLTLSSLVIGVRAARAQNVSLHKRTMISLVFYALIVTGAFTLLPGRIMFAVVSGG